jgi:hypothetical protein
MRKRSAEAQNRLMDANARLSRAVDASLERSWRDVAQHLVEAQRHIRAATQILTQIQRAP